ncbi:MAG: hypothetical protein ACJ8R9_05480 [Steroidobacteraceae bacterium]
MTDRTPFYVGFATLEELIATHQTELPIYLAAPTETHTTDTVGFSYRHTYLLVSDIQQGVCRYWRMPLGRVSEHCGESMEPELSRKILERALQTEAEVRKVLRARLQCEPQAAVVAFPRDLRYLDGTTNLLRYDPSSSRYISAS